MEDGSKGVQESRINFLTRNESFKVKNFYKSERNMR